MKKKNPYNRLIYLLLSLVFFLFALFAFISLRRNKDENTLLNIILIVFSINTIMIIFVIAIYDQILISLDESSKHQLKIDKHQMNQEFYHELSTKTNQLDLLKQEFNQHFSMIQDSLHQENYDQLKEYLNSITGQFEDSDDIIIVNNQVMSSLLQSKKSVCSKLNITLNLHIHFQKIYKISDIDVIVLLGNILDNAIEANEKVAEKNRYITLNIKQIKSYLKITCENPFSEMPVEKNGILLTSKAENKFHGIGLSNVKSTCIKYNGEFTYNFNKKTFYVELLLPNH